MRRESDQKGTVESEKWGMRLGNAVGQRPQRRRTRRQRSGRRYADYGRRDGRLLGWGNKRRDCAAFFAQTATTRLQPLVATGIGNVAGHGRGLCDTRRTENLQAATGKSQQ